MAKGKKGERQEPSPFDVAVSYGLQQLSKSSLIDNPLFIQQHIDDEALIKRRDELYEELVEKGIPEEKQEKYFVGNLSKYVAEGHALDDTGKKIILKKGLETKVGWADKLKDIFGAPTKDIHQTVNAFRDLYTMLKSSDYSKRMPELTEAVGKVYDMGFMDTAIDVLKAHDLMDDRKYKTLKKALGERASQAAGEVAKGIEQYIMPQQAQTATAAIMGILGVFMLTSLGSNITGNVISNASSLTSNILGIVLIVGALGLFVCRKKRN